MNPVQEKAIIRPSCTGLCIQRGWGRSRRWAKEGGDKDRWKESLRHVFLVGILLSWEGQTSVDMQKLPILLGQNSELGQEGHCATVEGDGLY